MSAWEMKGWKDVGLGGQKTEGKGREEGQRRIRGSEMGKSRGLRRGLSPHLTHLRREAVVSSPRRAADAPGATRWLRRRGPTGVGVGKGFASGWAGGRSVVELALARLVDEAALVPRPARTALAGAVLPLNHLGAQRLALRPRPGPLQPPRLARLLQQSSARRRRGGCVARGPRLSQDGRQLPAGTERGMVSSRLARSGGGHEHFPPGPGSRVPAQRCLGSEGGAQRPSLGCQPCLQANLEIAPRL